ncbi:MAG: heavy metal-responsive transcriptional regulator [Acidobacteriota bacterium]
MRIGEVAAQAEVNVQTVRLYERLGLLKKPGRRASGYREYTEDAVMSIRFVKQAKGLGFTLTEIKSLLDMRENGAHTIAEMRALAEARLSAIDEKIRQLQSMREAIHHGLSRCDCPEQFPACVFVKLFDETGSQSKEPG